MNYSKTFRGRLMLISSLAACALFAASAFATPVVKLSGEGLVEVSATGSSPFTLSGNASHLGTYECYGEIEFVRSEEGTLTGSGIAVIRAANGDLIVGVVSWQSDINGTGQISFSWRDSVEFSDGSVVSDTGRFIDSRPAGAISRLKMISDGTSNIIAILIG
jgi:hypothetical protein